MEKFNLESLPDMDCELYLRLNGKITYADEIFILFLLKAEYPITIEQILNYYKTKIKRYGNIETRHRDDGTKYEIEIYSPSQIKSMSLAWFDRRLGKMFRLGLMKPFINYEYLKTIRAQLNKRQ